MKSLRVFVCILITTLSLFVAFSLPEKSFAAVSESDHNNLKGYAQEIEQVSEAIRMQSIIGDILSNKEISNNYLNILEKNFNSVKSDPSYTSSRLELQVLIEFTDYLNKEIAKSAGNPLTSNYLDVLRRVLNITTNKRANATARVQLQAGTITQAEYDAAVQNATKIATAGNNALANEGDSKCSFLNPGICVSDALTWFIKTFLLEIAGFLLWATASIFNYSIIVGVLNFAQWAPPTLYPLWLVVRQILSLIIVFVGLYLGFLYIIGDEKERFKRYMPWVITFALFVNFSYPLARTVIDVSNIITLKVYTSAIGNGTLNPSSTGSATAGGIIVSHLGLQSLIAGSKATPTGGTIDMVKNINSVPASLLLVVFIFYSAYIFFMVTALIVVRTAAFVFMIVVSPLLFVDSVLPMLGEKAKEMRKIFLDQLIVGPVFMIMLALTLKFLEVFSDGALKSVKVDTTIRDFFNLLLMLIMLHIMLKVTKSVSGQLGTFATDAIGKVGGLGLGAATGGMAFAGRQLAGRAVAGAKNRGWVSKDPDSVSNRFANTLSTSSFDLRNSKVVAKGAGMAGLGSGLFGVGMGAGHKGGFDEDSKRKAEALTATAKRIPTRHERDFTDKDGNVHKKGDLDEEAINARNAYLSKGSIFLTKQQNEKLREEVLTKEKSEKDEERMKAIERYKKFDDTPEDIKAKKELFDKQDEETKQKLLKYDQDKTIEKYKKFDDSPEEAKAKQDLFDRQDEETKKRLLKYDQSAANEENQKRTKEIEDKRYKEEQLQAQKDLAQAQKQLAEAVAGKNVPEKQSNKVDIDLSTPAANNPSYNGTATTTVTPQAPAKSLVVDEHGNSFDLAGAIGGDREAARAARARRTKPENAAANTNTPKDATVAA